MRYQAPLNNPLNQSRHLDDFTYPADPSKPDLPRSDQQPLRALLDTFAESIVPSPEIIDLSFSHPRRIVQVSGYDGRLYRR